MRRHENKRYEPKLNISAFDWKSINGEISVTTSLYSVEFIYSANCIKNTCFRYFYSLDCFRVLSISQYIEYSISRTATQLEQNNRY